MRPRQPRPRPVRLPVEETLAALRIEVTKAEGDERWAQCPEHHRRTGKTDRNPSWSINVRTGAHYCFSCHLKGNLYSLVTDLRGKAAADRLLSETQQYGRPVSVSRRVRRPGTFRRPDDLRRKPKLLPRSWLAVYGRPPQWALDRRRLTFRAAVDYDVRWDATREAWILPLYTPDLDHLVGYQVKAEQGRFFRNHPHSSAKSTTLFGVGVASGDVVVVESPLDAVLLWRLGYDAVAICGSRVSDEQLLLLDGYDSTTFALDNDTAGQREHKRLASLGVRAHYLHYVGPWKDVGEMPDAAIRLALEERRPFAASGLRR